MSESATFIAKLTFPWIPAAPSGSRQRTVRSRSVLPHRAARHGIHRRRARGARPPRRRSPISASVDSLEHTMRARGRRWSASPRCTRSKPTTCWRSRRTVRRALARRADRHRRAHRRGLSRTVPVADVAAVVLDDGERALPRLCEALERGRPLTDGARPRAAGRSAAVTSAPPARPARSCSTTCRCRRGITWTAGADNTPVWRIGRPG